jgi:putative membrane protein
MENSPEKDLTRPREMPFLYLKGFAMGSADVVPGVSGGTMALILGIYSRLVFGIKSVDVQAIRQLVTLRWADMFGRIHWKFLISVFLGGISAVFFFTRVIELPVLMHTHPEGIYGLFFGLITGSILLLLKAIGDVGWRQVLTVAAGVAVGLRIVTLVPTDTPETSLFVFLSGSLAITAMVLPGISGSFILLILRKYEYILGNIALLGTDRTMEAVMVLIPFGLGMVVGLVLFVRLLSWLIKRYHIFTLCLLVGFMAGSLYVIWPYQEREYVEIADTQVFPLDHPRVQELLEHSYEGREPERRRPEYWKLGSVINPAAPATEQKIEVVHVRRRMVSSSPYWPEWTSPSDDGRLRKGAQSLYGGLGTMLVGFLLVGWLGRLSRGKEPGSDGLP